MGFHDPSRLRGENGTAIVSVLLVLTVLMIIGVSSMSTSTVELQVATHDARHKMAFFQADGGARVRGGAAGAEHMLPRRLLIHNHR